jgi:hypothetical protein
MAPPSSTRMVLWAQSSRSGSVTQLKKASTATRVKTSLEAHFLHMALARALWYTTRRRTELTNSVFRRETTLLCGFSQDKTLRLGLKEGSSLQAIQSLLRPTKATWIVLLIGPKMGILCGTLAVWRPTATFSSLRVRVCSLQSAQCPSFNQSCAYSTKYFLSRT